MRTMGLLLARVGQNRVRVRAWQAIEIRRHVVVRLRRTVNVRVLCVCVCVCVCVYVCQAESSATVPGRLSKYDDISLFDCVALSMCVCVCVCVCVSGRI